MVTGLIVEANYPINYYQQVGAVFRNKSAQLSQSKNKVVAMKCQWSGKVDGVCTMPELPFGASQRCHRTLASGVTGEQKKKCTEREKKYRQEKPGQRVVPSVHSDKLHIMQSIDICSHCSSNTYREGRDTDHSRSVVVVIIEEEDAAPARECQSAVGRRRSAGRTVTCSYTCWGRAATDRSDS